MRGHGQSAIQPATRLSPALALLAAAPEATSFIPQVRAKQKGGPASAAQPVTLRGRGESSCASDRGACRSGKMPILRKIHSPWLSMRPESRKCDFSHGDSDGRVRGHSFGDGPSPRMSPPQQSKASEGATVARARSILHVAVALLLVHAAAVVAQEAGPENALAPTHDPLAAPSASGCGDCSSDFGCCTPISCGCTSY